MNKLINYFYPKQTLGYFDNKRTIFFIRLVFISLIIIPIFIIAEIINNSGNITVSTSGALSIGIFLFISLFIIKRYGIIIAGNIVSLVVIIILLFWMNIIPEDTLPIYKYVQGYYSVYALLILSALLASRLVILINATLILITTTHLFIFSTLHHQQNIDILTTGYINHSIILILITAIIFYLHKFTESAIAKANKELEVKEQKNQELLSSEEELRASNEELIATTDALKESNNELIIASKKAGESDRLKTEFLNNISHEVRTPMNGILGFTQLLLSPNLKTTDKEFYIDIISNNGNQLLKIIDDIIEISKLETKQVSINKTSVNINNLLSILFSEYENKTRKKELSLYIGNKLSDESIQILTDKVKLNIILRSFLDNAIKFTNSGSIELGCNIIESNNTKSLQLYVKDTGIGIEKEKQKLIFKRFSQAESDLSRTYGGLGLGLSIAYENAILIDGNINFTSIKNEGSVFYITIIF